MFVSRANASDGRSLWRRLSSTPGRAAVALVALLAVACTGGGGSGVGEGPLAGVDLSDVQIVVGSKDFTEQQILGQIAIHALRSVGATVTDRTDLGGTGTVRRALETSEIDLYWEYTGTGWAIHLGEDPLEASHDAGLLHDTVDRTDRAENEVAWLAPAPMNDTYGFAVSEANRRVLDLDTLTDLANRVRNQPLSIELCVDNEFRSRADGGVRFEDVFSLNLLDEQIRIVSYEALYEQASEGECASEVFTTDGRVDSYGLHVLDDDADVFLVYNPAPTVRVSFLEAHPELGEVFDVVSSTLTDEAMRAMNRQVDLDGETPSSVARRHLRDTGLIE